MRFFFQHNLSILLLFILNSCNSSQQKPITQRQTSPATATTDTSVKTDAKTDQSDGEEEDEEEPANEFYQIQGERPQEVCGETGFAYLWKGYLVPECGPCHHPENIYNVTVFADRKDEAASFQVMRSLGKIAFMDAVTKNPLCTKCNLKAEDPLLTDIDYFMDHRTSCEN